MLEEENIIYLHLTSYGKKLNVIQSKCPNQNKFCKLGWFDADNTSCWKPEYSLVYLGVLSNCRIAAKFIWQLKIPDSGWPTCLYLLTSHIILKGNNWKYKYILFN